MANNTVTVSGMFGNGKTYFSGSPVVIDIGGLEWPDSSSFNIVRLEVIYNGNVVGKFHAETGGQSNISFDISSALRAIWILEDFRDEVSDAQDVVDGLTPELWVRDYKPYSLIVYTEYIDSQDGEFVTTSSGEISGGRCAIGRFTERERSAVRDKKDADVSYREHQNARNGDASTKPTSYPERVGSASITSWVDVQNNGTQSIFYPPSAGGGSGTTDSPSAHAPIVLRDSVPYVDFLFVNRRGAVETCSGQTFEAMGIKPTTRQYAHVERPNFQPSRSLIALSYDGRRSWSMSSGHQTREWAEWWALEFLAARKWWMLYDGKYIPVLIEPQKQDITIYDRSKQQMMSVDFTVTAALEG